MLICAAKVDDQCCSPMRSIQPTPPRRWLMLRPVTTRRCRIPAGGAAATQALVTDLRAEVGALGRHSVYEKIDLPLAPVLYRMEKSGVRIDTDVLGGLSGEFGSELDRVGERIFSLAGRRFNINSPKQLGEVLFKDLDCRMPVEIRQRQDDLDGPGRSGTAGGEPRGSTSRARISPLVQAEIHLRRFAAAAGRLRIARAYHVSSRRNVNRASLLHQSESAKHSHSHRAWPRDSCGFHRCSGHATAFCRLFADRAPAARTFQRRSAPRACLPGRTRISTP